MYSAKKSRDEEAHSRWMKLLELEDGRVAVHACQRHFPAGAPTRNHPDPNPNLFNPIPNQVKEQFSYLTLIAFKVYIFAYLISHSFCSCPPPTVGQAWRLGLTSSHCSIQHPTAHLWALMVYLCHPLYSPHLALSPSWPPMRH